VIVLEMIVVAAVSVLGIVGKMVAVMVRESAVESSLMEDWLVFENMQAAVEIEELRPVHVED
jgi:hypothetical protein